MIFSKFHERLRVVEKHQALCSDQHKEHARRIGDSISIQNSQDATLKEILGQLKVFNENFLPVIIRARNDQITRDTLKSWALWVSTIIGGVSAIVAAYHFMA